MSITVHNYDRVLVPNYQVFTCIFGLPKAFYFYRYWFWKILFFLSCIVASFFVPNIFRLCKYFNSQCYKKNNILDVIQCSVHVLMHSCTHVLKVHILYFSFRKKFMMKDLIQLNYSSHSHFRS